jgi:hypothetical protein
MKNSAALILTLLAAGFSGSIASAVRAEDQPPVPQSSQPAAPKTTHDNMMGSDMPGMMKMMGQMTQMMEKCDKMMQSTMDHQKEKARSSKTDGRG